MNSGALAEQKGLEVIARAFKREDEKAFGGAGASFAEYVRRRNQLVTASSHGPRFDETVETGVIEEVASQVRSE